MRLAAAEIRGRPEGFAIADSRNPDTCTIPALGAAPAPATRKSAPGKAVSLRQVSKLFGTLPVLRELTALFTEGSSTVLLGANGAGKSTLLRLIAGLVQPTRGSVSVFGAPPQDIRHRIGYMSHSTMLYDELSAMENLEYFATLGRRDGCACVASPEMALRAVSLDPKLRRPVGQFSQGMRQRVAFARVLQSDPDLLLLDEPFSNMDVASVEAMVALIADFRTWPTTTGGGRTVILTTHQADRARPLADQFLELAGGALRTVARPAA